jgi:hypothetical protein
VRGGSAIVGSKSAASTCNRAALVTERFIALSTPGFRDRASVFAARLRRIIIHERPFPTLQNVLKRLRFKQLPKQTCIFAANLPAAHSP